MTRPVESVPADPVLFIILVRDRVMEGVRGQGLVERGIENCDLLLIRKQFGGDANPLGARRIVQRRQIRQFFDSAHYALRDQGRSAKIFSPMNDAMPDRFQFKFFASADEIDDSEERCAMICAGHRLLMVGSGQIDHFQGGAVREQSLGDS
jgi:hypothetical protein